MHQSPRITTVNVTQVPSMFINVKELTHYSKRVGHEVVAVLCEWQGGVWVVETYNNTTIAETSTFAKAILFLFDCLHEEVNL